MISLNNLVAVRFSHLNIGNINLYRKAKRLPGNPKVYRDISYGFIRFLSSLSDSLMSNGFVLNLFHLLIFFNYS